MKLFLFLKQMFGAALFGLTVWIRAEPGFDEWVRMLNIGVYYIGIYILIGAGVIIMVVSFLGCVSALMENTFALFVVCLAYSSSPWSYSFVFIVYRYTNPQLHNHHSRMWHSDGFQYNEF